MNAVDQVVGGIGRVAERLWTIRLEGRGEGLLGTVRTLRRPAGLSAEQSTKHNCPSSKPPTRSGSPPVSSLNASAWVRKCSRFI